MRTFFAIYWGVGMLALVVWGLHILTRKEPKAPKSEREKVDEFIEEFEGRLPRVQRISVAAIAFYRELEANCGATADWPLDLIGRDKESAQRIADLLTALGKEIDSK